MNDFLGDLFIYLMNRADAGMWTEYCFITAYDPEKEYFQGPICPSSEPETFIYTPQWMLPDIIG